jgi:hypothetical protein
VPERRPACKKPEQSERPIIWWSGWEIADEVMKRGIGAQKPDGQPTVADMLLFGREQQFFLLQNGLVYVCSAATEPRGLPGQSIYARREDFKGGPARVVESYWAILLREMRGEAVVRGLKHGRSGRTSSSKRAAALPTMSTTNYALPFPRRCSASIPTIWLKQGC